MNMVAWPTDNCRWGTDCLRLTTDGASQLPEIKLEDILIKSQEFPITFPRRTMTIKNLELSVKKEILERNIRSAYPILHEHSLYLCAKFLLYKRNHGTEKEKILYKDISLKGLIQRLLFKRAVSFFGESDSYFLINKTKGAGNWHTISTEEETIPLILENCLSYDEIKLSALLSVSSYSYFINDGNRNNAGYVEENRSKIEEEGIVIGLIGTRFEQLERMEYQEIIVSDIQNTEEKGYGNSSTPSLQSVFAEFYEENCFTYNNVKSLEDTRFLKLNDGLYFNNNAYSKRLALSFDTLLIEANHRAKERNKTAYIHVVGIGLGVWKISSHQTHIFLDTFVGRLKFLGENLSNISDINFSYISEASKCVKWKNGDILPINNHPNKGIKLYISKREPFTKLLDEGKLLVVSYAWDGNALPGNEFWVGMLRSTGDSSTACSTQITEIHNPHINPLVCADNLHVAMLDGTVKPIDEVYGLL